MGCGGGNSEEAKALLNRILQVIGIPYNIVVNICQDSNDNGICEAIELQTKVSIKKGDDLNIIMTKVSLTTDGEYFLENYDSSKKILMEIQDSANVVKNDGKFTFTYNPKTQELSILQMMIDEGFLTANDVKEVRSMSNVDDFYETIFQDFETNLNILGEEELSSPRAVLANMNEMADELIANGVRDTLPQSINDCNGEQSCIDETLSSLSTELQIDENESETIKKNETVENKQLLGNKTLYSYGRDDDGNREIYENHFNSDVTAFSWEVIEGVSKGETGTDTISIEGNKMIDYTENEVYLLLGKYSDYLLYQVKNSNKEAKLYFDLNKLRIDLEEESKSKPNLEKLIIGKTYYIPVCDTKAPHVERLEFNSNGSSFHISWIQDGETQNRDYTYSVNGDILTLIIENGEKLTFTNFEENENSIISSSDDGVFWKNESDAQRELDKGICSENEPTSIGFTKEMLQNKVVYELAYVEEDGTKGYGKTTFKSETSGTRHEIAISTDGEVVEDENFDINFYLENGNIVYDTGDDLIFWRFNSQDDEAWHVSFEKDNGKDGSIDFSEDKILYFNKPANYPEDL